MKTISSWAYNGSFKLSLESKTMPPKSVKRHSAIGLSTTCLAWHSKASVLQHQLLCSSTKIHSIVDVDFYTVIDVSSTIIIDHPRGKGQKSGLFTGSWISTLVLIGKISTFHLCFIVQWFFEEPPRRFHVMERVNHRFFRELRCT